MKLIPYKSASASAKSLAEALGIVRVKHDGAALNLRGQRIINWGCSVVTRQLNNHRWINPPESVERSIDKLNAFTVMEEGDVEVPEFTTEKDQALAWIREGKKVMCRTKLKSYGGDGIVYAEAIDQIVDAPLYVRYMPKEHEYRVHVMNGEVFFAQRKARKLDVPDDQVNWKIRNLAGGFIYANQNIEIGEEVRANSVRAVSSLGLDFGAVDVLVTAKGRVYVLEVNTACGLAGTTLDKYVEAFQQHYGVV